MATCLQGYDTTCYPRASDWSFTRFYLPHAFAAGYRLIDDAQGLWQVFEALHHKCGLPGPLEIPMESFTRAVEIVLKDGMGQSDLTYRPTMQNWQQAVRACGYIQSRQATSQSLLAIPRAA